MSFDKSLMSCVLAIVMAMGVAACNKNGSPDRAAQGTNRPSIAANPQTDQGPMTPQPSDKAAQQGMNPPAAGAPQVDQKPSDRTAGMTPQDQQPSDKSAGENPQADQAPLPPVKPPKVDPLKPDKTRQ